MPGREIGNTGKLELLLVSEGIADLDGTVIMDADNIAWIGILHIVAILGHEDSGGVGFLSDVFRPIYSLLGIESCFSEAGVCRK